ncbi:MAG: glycosyltransferase family 39 protein, partial [Chloroflexi bacterium]|nr:glycosyltransferase family 39 protein [Chloroflexota bacterium]
QGDEVNVVHIAASAIQGREDALFYHKIGPAELLTTAVFYGGARLLTESGARLPFAVANILFVLGLYSLAHRFMGRRAAFWVGLLAALNGFFVAFGRIVQYQSLVLLFGVLALYSALAYAERRRAREVWLCALFATLGLLAHTDALFAALAAAMVILVVLGKERPSWRQAAQRL